MTLRPRLLVLTPRYPYPVVGGDRLRIHEVCKALCERLDLTLLSLCESTAEASAPVPPEAPFRQIERVVLPRWSSWLQSLTALPGSLPLQVAYYRSAAFDKQLERLLPAHDGVLAHLIRTGDAVRRSNVATVPRFLEMTDAISLNYERVQRSRRGRSLRAHVFSIEADRLLSYERQVVDDFDLSFLVSEVDRQHLFGSDTRRLQRTMVCSNGVDLQRLPYQFERNAADIVFIGNLQTLQNLDAATFMATDVLPVVRRQRPDARLRIIGRIKNADARSLGRHEGVVVTGEVPNVAAAAAGGAVGVCPVRLGAGVQNKVLEYLALGLPTVTTSVGFEGLGVVPDRDILVADNAKTFAEAVIQLLRDREAAAAMAEAGRRHVEDHHSWSAMLQPMVDAVVERVARRRAAVNSPQR